MNAPKPAAVERAVAEHRRLWGTPAVVTRAPGRVNLIGEHTDYNDGFVLPMALPFDTAVSVSAVDEGQPAVIESEGFGRALLNRELSPGSSAGTEWAVHIRGVDQLLRQAGVDIPAWRATVATDVPTGASLSSSASLEIAAGMALLALAGQTWSPTEIALLGQRVENEIVGLPSGIMDQLISAIAVDGHASLIDCRTLSATESRLPTGAVVAVMDTLTRRELVDSEYDDRRATCNRAAAHLGVAALRDATLSDLARLTPGSLEYRRAHHIVTENQRTLDAAAAMAADDAVTLGRLMNASHTSLRDDYEVSGPALDRIVTVAQGSPGCFGARMTGGGFAGCAVALVDADRVAEFCTAVAQGYYQASGIDPTIWVCQAAPGGSVLDL